MKKVIIRALIIISILLGFHRVCLLEALNSLEDYLKYRKYSIEDFSVKLNRQDGALINEIRHNVKQDEGVLTLDSEQYFINYYAYPVKLYKFKKGYYGTSKIYAFSDVDQKWLDERNIKWLLLCDDNKKFHLKKIREMAR